MKNKDTQSRKYQLTINNPTLPIEDGKEKIIFSHDEIKSRLNSLNSVTYFCMSDEIGLEGNTPHTHIYIHASAPIRFSTIKKQFPTAHIENAYGSAQLNRDYIRKEGKWKGSNKSETSLEGTFEEYGELPVNKRLLQGTDFMELIYLLITEGYSEADIIKLVPNSIMLLDKIQRTKQIIQEDIVKNQWRSLIVTYISGSTGTGKTKYVMEKYGYSSVYRVTDYVHPYDGYDSNRTVLCYEEFASSLPINDMLKYLDGYPLVLPARYSNKQATYTEVFFTTNIPLEKQYPNIQINEPEVWKAFLRRIHKVMIFNEDGTIDSYDSVDTYLNRNNPITDKYGFHMASDEELRDIPFV